MEVKVQVAHLAYFDKAGLGMGDGGWAVVWIEKGCCLAAEPSWDFRVFARTLQITTWLRGRGAPLYSSSMNPSVVVNLDLTLILL